MVLCINAGAKVTLFIGSTTLFANLLSCEVMIFNKWGVAFLVFTARSFGLHASLPSFRFFVFFPFFSLFPMFRVACFSVRRFCSCKQKVFLSLTFLLPLHRFY